MTTTRRPVEPNQATARPVLAIQIDIGQLIEAVRRHLPLSPMAAHAIRNDLANLFSTTRVAVLSGAPTRKAAAAGDLATNPPPRATQ